MVTRWALLDGQTCVAIILWDGNTDTYNPAPYTAVPYDPAVHVVAVDPKAVNKANLEDKAVQALTNNATFLALASPNTTQNANQIKALTRQVNALIRLRRDDLLDDVTGT